MNIISSKYEDIVQAQPMCLNENKKNILRKCKASQWIPSDIPYCNSSQFAYEHSDLCPMNYHTLNINGKSLCYRITKPKPWLDECLYDGSTTIFYDLDSDEKYAIIKMLNAHNLTEVWMPAKRFTKFGSVTWRIAGPLYSETVEFDKLNIDLIDEKNIAENGCFSAIVESNMTAGLIKNCDHELSILCIYQLDTESLLSLACTSNHLTVPYRDNENKYCYSIREYDSNRYLNLLGSNESAINWIRSQCNNGDLFSMNSIQKTHIFIALSEIFDLEDNDHCLFAVLPENIFVTDEHHWNAISKNVEYVNWDYPLTNGTFLTVNHKGKWNWIERSFNCIACQNRIEDIVPELVLSFNKRKRRLCLTIYDEEYLWHKPIKDEKHFDKPAVKCFTNADEQLIRNVEIIKRKWYGIMSTKHLNQNISTQLTLREKSKAIYELKLYGDGPGYYWCEGYTILQFNLIKSAKIVAFKHEKGEVFAMNVKTLCDNCEKIFLENCLKDLSKQMKDYLKDLYRNLRKTNQYQDRFGHTEINIENIRIMEIENIYKKSNENCYADILYHLTVSAEKFDEKTSIGYHNRIPKNDFRIFLMKEIIVNVFKSDTNNSNSKYEFKSLNSTEICLPEYSYAIDGLNWMSAKIGETTSLNELCLLSNGLPVLRSCVGDFLYGGIWKNITQQHCYRKPDEITQQLFEIYNELIQRNEFIDRNKYIISNITKLLQDYSRNKNFVAADVFYLGRILNDLFRLNDDGNINNNNSITTLNLNDTEHIFSIYNNLMYLNESTTRKSAALNSTNILLDAFDNIINSIPMNITSVAKYCNNVIVNPDDGTLSTQTPNLIVYVIDPFIKNVSGVALIKKTQQQIQNNDFTDYFIKILYANQSSDELLYENNLEIASYVPMDLLLLLNETRNQIGFDLPDLKIVISIYYNDRLFKEFKNTTHAEPAGKIISVSIPGYDSDLPALLPIFMKISNFSTELQQKKCGYWNFESDFAQWSHDGCEFGGISQNKNDSVILCVCSHLTHYSYLIIGTFPQSLDADEDDCVIKESHKKALDMITLLGCSLSLLGVCGIAITAIVFRTWREKASSIVLLQLSAAIALQMILLCFVNTEYSSEYLIAERRINACVALGALLQYSILVAFSWMFITAYLQFMRYVKVLGATRSTRFFLKSFLIGWLTPVLPVLIVIIAAPQSYVQSVEISKNGGICYPSGASLYFGLIIPIGMIIIANLIIFILVIYNILVGSSVRSNKRDLMMAQFRLSVFLFFLLGLTWIFGFLASIRSEIIFSYLFCLTATIQGFVLFIYFIILDPSTRKLWQHFFDNLLC